MKVGFSELLVIFAVAMIFIGPDKMPAYARKAGQWLSKLRDYTDVATKQVQDTIPEPLEQIQKPIKDITDPLNGIQENLNKSMSEVTKSIDSIGRKKAQDKKAALENEEIVDLEEAAPAAEAKSDAQPAPAQADAPLEAAAPAQPAPAQADTPLEAAAPAESAQAANAAEPAAEEVKPAGEQPAAASAEKAEAAAAAN